MNNLGENGSQNPQQHEGVVSSGEDSVELAEGDYRMRYFAKEEMDDVQAPPLPLQERPTNCPPQLIETGTHLFEGKMSTARPVQKAPLIATTPHLEEEDSPGVGMQGELPLEYFSRKDQQFTVDIENLYRREKKAPKKENTAPKKRQKKQRHCKREKAPLPSNQAWWRQEEEDVGAPVGAKTVLRAEDAPPTASIVEEEESTRRRLERHLSRYGCEEEDLVIQEVEEGEGSELEEELDEEEKDFCKGYVLADAEGRRVVMTENRAESQLSNARISRRTETLDKYL